MKMEALIKILKKDIERCEDVDEFKIVCDKSLKLAKENLLMMLAVPSVFVDVIALGIYPYVRVNTEKMNSFFSTYDIFSDELPDLDTIKEQGFLETDPEINAFMQKLIIMDKNLVIKILFAIAWLKIS